eukprot:gene3442-6091_t
MSIHPTFTTGQELLNYLKDNQPKNKFEYFVGVDVGATNTRIGIVFKIENKYISTPRYKFKCSKVQFLIDSLNNLTQEFVYLLKQDASGCCLAIAGPIEEGGDQVTITNYEGENKKLFKSDLPKSLSNNIYLINDLEAACFGIISLSEDNLLGKYFTNAWEEEVKNENIKLKNFHYCVCAMGTGLGTAVIRFNPNDKSFSVLTLEGGHCKATFPGRKAENRSKDMKRLEYLSKNLYNCEYSIEFEDICSGRGLQSCYEFEILEQENEKKLNSGESKSKLNITYLLVAKASLEGNKYAFEAMMAHYRYLMKAAQNISIMTVCKGVFFAGDNQVSNEEFFSKNAKYLASQFTGHVKSDWLEKMDAYRQIEMFNLNLCGTFYYIKTQMEKNQVEKVTTKSKHDHSITLDVKKPLIAFGLSFFTLFGLNYFLNKNGDIQSKY